MEKIYIVHWGSAFSDDDGNAKAYTGIHGVYTSKADALRGLVECKDVTYDEVVQNEDPETLEYAKQNTHVYGSYAEEYFEIDYDLGAGPCEIHITITEQ
jgi:hypothetical protein